MLLVAAGTPQLIRNLDIAAELEKLARESCLTAQASSPSQSSLESSLAWIDSAARALTQVEQGMRRNLLRSLSLDAMAVSLLRD
jgi:DNA polymerase-3 subunit delta'